jgi:hypothetical protein
MRSFGVLLGATLTCAALSAVVWANAEQQAPATAPQGAPPAGRGRAAGPPPRIITFEARPASIKPGESVQLVWHVENPAAAAIEPGIGRVIPRGTQRVTPAVTTTFTLTNGAVTSTVTVTVAGTKPAAAASAASEAVKKPIARTADGKPDFSGVYAFGGGGGGRGAAAGRGNAPAGPTLKPGAEKYRVNRAANPQDTGRTSDCMPLVPPDAFGVPYQFQIIQSKDYVVFFHEYPGTFRIIPLNAEREQLEPDPAWLGDSIARWEGDTLVIDTIGYNDKT